MNYVQGRHLTGKETDNMPPVPEDKETNGGEKHQNRKNDDSELEMPAHIIPPVQDSSDDNEDDTSNGADSDMDYSAHDGYMLLLPQDGEISEDDCDDEAGSDFHGYLPPSALVEMTLPPEPLTEVRGAGVDVTEAVAEGSVHPAFAAHFPDNKIPVHLQLPKPPKTQKDDVLWNQPVPSARLHLDSAQVDKVKSAMAGFKLPAANIPDWAKQISEDQWHQRLLKRLTSPHSVSAEVEKKASVKDNSADGELPTAEKPNTGADNEASCAASTPSARAT